MAASVFCTFINHSTTPLDIELAMNVYKTYVRSIYVLFPGGCEGASKLELLEKPYETTNMLKVNNKERHWL